MIINICKDSHIFINLHIFQSKIKIATQSIQFIIMAEPQHQSSNPPPNREESLNAKLQILQNENHSLQQERQSFETNIRRYINTINDLDYQLSQKNKENTSLVQKNREVTAKCRRLELDTERASDQYTYLYNYVHTDRKRGNRDLIIKEMELNNKLNLIQHEGYSQIIWQLKDSLHSKNQQIIALTTQNGKLKKDILQITFEYTQQIASYKEDIATLKAQANLYKPSESSQVPEENISESFAIKKIQGLQSELRLCERQYSIVSKDLLECKKVLNHYKRDNELLKIKLDNKDTSTCLFDFQQMKNLLDQNKSLKKQIQQQKLKYFMIIQKNPSLLNQINQVNVISPIEELQVSIIELQYQIEQKDKEIIILKANLQKSHHQKHLKQQQFFKLKNKTVKVIQKLTTIITNFVPCFNLYGFSEFGLNQQQSKFVQQHSMGMQKQFNRVCSQLILKNSQLQKLETKIKDFQNKLQTKSQRVDLVTKNNQSLKKQNQKLLASVELLTHKLTQMQYSQQYAQYPPQHPEEELPAANYQFQQVPEGYDINQQIRQFQQRQDRSLQVQQPNSQINSLRELVSELQKDRQNMLEIIRSKDIIIAEANAQLKINRSQFKPKVYQFETFQKPPTFQQTSTSNNTDNHRTNQILQKFTQEYRRLQEQIWNMGQNYQAQIILLRQQSEKKYLQLRQKYTKLLTDNHNLEQKCTQLETAYEQNLKKAQQKKDRVGQNQENEKEDQIAVEGHTTNRDQNNSINQSTIQTINELLKKYQKQFNRFTNFYQSEMIKSRQFKASSNQQNQNESIQSQLQNKIQRIEQILSQNQQTIVLLETELKQKQLQIRAERQNYQSNEQISEQRLVQLQSRLNQLNAQLQILQRKATQNLSSNDNSSIQQSSVLITVLVSKNNQIASLKQQLQQLQLTLTNKNKEIASLQARITDQLSELEIQQFNTFKTYIQENNLSYILQKVYEKLSHSQLAEEQ